MDKKSFYMGPKDCWRWRHTASNGKIVGSSSQGYKMK